MSSKNATIKESIRATRERHAGMTCRVFEIKVDESKLSREKKQLLDQYFREAKWLRNSELAKGDLSLMNRNAKTATVKIGDTYKVCPLLVLGSQMRQDIVDQIKSEIRGLATKRAEGQRVGALKFKSYCNSLPLRQYGTTYRINFEKNTIAIQNMSKLPIKVRGLKQLPSDGEIANAKLIRKASGYYFHITVFTVPQEKPETGVYCGIDFGIGNNLTLDDGRTFNICVPESKAIKLASKRVNRSYHHSGKKKKKSKNHYRRVNKLRVAYEKQNNRKADMANKVTSSILAEHDFIAIQDEMIANWHKGLFGKQVQHSAMGSIKMKLKTNSKVHVVNRSFPSTQICLKCGQMTRHSLSERSYRCQHCGYTHSSRDAKAAYCILIEALNQYVSTERRTKSPVEARPSTAVSVLRNCRKTPPVKQEAQVL